MIGNSGIYLIINIINDMIYVGQAIHFYRRFGQHRYELENNEHGNSYLQNAYDKYGKKSFVFLKLEIIQDSSRLDEREDYWIKYFKSSNRSIGYNLRINPKTNRGHSFSKEIRKRMGDGRRGKKRKPFTAETKRKMSENGKKQKFTDEQIDRLKTQNIGRKHLKEHIEKRANSMRLTNQRKINEVIDDDLDFSSGKEIKL